MDNALQEAIDRIQRMEMYFDKLCDGLNAQPPVVYPQLAETLRRYYTGGQWLNDYELDESGILPNALKRGVLSQDGIYDLLDRIKELN